MDQDDNRSIVMAEVMTPDKANFSGHVHGGHLMQLLDKVAYACAARYAGHQFHGNRHPRARRKPHDA